jgi:hypothetical protein
MTTTTIRIHCLAVSILGFVFLSFDLPFGPTFAWCTWPVLILLNTFWAGRLWELQKQLKSWDKELERLNEEDAVVAGARHREHLNVVTPASPPDSPASP